MTIALAGEDLAGVVLVAGPGGTLTGRIVTDTGVPVPQPERRMTVVARAVDPTRTFTTFNQDNGRVKEDWTFEVKDVTGLNRLSVSPLPRDWAIKSIEYDGKDLMDTPLDVASAQHIEGITVILSKSLPPLATTQAEAGDPLRRCCPGTTSAISRRLPTPARWPAPR